MMRLIIASGLNIPVLGCGAGGVDRFAADMGDEAAGIVGPSQWEEQVRITPELGPASAEFARPMRAADSSVGCDYPAAQAYAACLLALAALPPADSLRHQRLRAAVFGLRTTP